MTWQDQCRQRGGEPRVFPAGHPLAGYPACRTTNADGSVSYHMVAPITDYIQAMVGDGIDYATAMSLGAAASAGETVVQGAAGAIPRAVSWLTGIPTWALWLGAAYLGWRALNAALPPARRAG